MRWTASCTSGEKSWTPDREPVEPERRERVDVLERRDARIDLDADLRVVREPEVLGHGGDAGASGPQAV